MRETTESLRARISIATMMLKGLVRRVVSSLTDGASWQVLGHAGEDGKRESFGADVFQGVGFASRPAGAAEVILVNVGGAGEHPVIVATRDLSTKVTLNGDETAIFNSKVLVKIGADGVVSIATHGTELTPLDELVHGRGIDTFTGAPFSTLGSTSSKVRAEK